MLAGLRARERFGFRRFLLSTASRLNGASACRGFVLAHRCGAAPDLHRVPFFSSENTQRTSTGRSLLRHSIFVNSDVLASSAIDEPRCPVESHPVHDPDSNINHGCIQRRSFCLAVSDVEIGDFHVHDLRIPSPCDSSIKELSQSSTTNDSYIPDHDIALCGKFAEWGGNRGVG